MLWVFMTAHSSAVRAPGLFRMCSGTEILPMSCKEEAFAISAIFDRMDAYWSDVRHSWVSSILVMERMLSTCMPLSPLRNSTMWLRSSTMMRLLFSLSSICSVTMFSSMFCFE